VLKPLRFIKKLLILSLFFTLFSCAQGKVDPFDTNVGLSRSDFQKTLLADKKEMHSKKSEGAQSNSPIPNISKLIISPPPPAIGGDKIISFAITDQTPIKDVLIELGRVAKIDIDLDPTISGGIIVNAKNRPLKEVIDRIATLGKLRYSYRNSVLHFEPDTPRTKTYFVDYLKGNSLWDDVESNIKAILSRGTGSSSTGSTASKSTTATASAPATASGAGTSTSKSSAGTSSSGAAVLSSNKSAGIILIYATDQEHKMVADYLSEVEKHASAQVLIEAKVVEVTLKDEFKTGIEWKSDGHQNDINSTNSYVAGSAFSYVAKELFNTSLEASISAIETFGTTRTLSSPRIHAINNQKASLNFSDKLIYFTVSQTQSTSASGAATAIVATTITSTKQEENVGVQLDITPSINLKTSEVTLDIQPKLSIFNSWVLDPASPKDLLDTKGVRIINQVPVIQTRTMSTVAKIQSGGVFVIGGLMKETTANDDSGVPFLSRIPLLGWLFKSISKKSEVVETVIFIKATIINSGSLVDKNDRNYHDKLDSNRRPLFNR